MENRQIAPFLSNFWVLRVCDIDFCVYGNCHIFMGPTHVVHSGLHNTWIEIWTKATSLNRQYTFLQSRHPEDNKNSNYVVCPAMIKKAYNSWTLFPKKPDLCGPFLWIGFSCLKATEPPEGGSLLFTVRAFRSAVLDF